MGFEKLQRLPVAQMAVTPTDALFQMVRIIPLLQHRFIEIRLQECRMTTAKMLYKIFTGGPDISKNTDLDVIMTNDKTIGIAGIVVLFESRNNEIPDHDRPVRFKRPGEMIVDGKAARPECRTGDVNG